MEQIIIICNFNESATICFASLCFETSVQWKWTELFTSWSRSLASSFPIKLMATIYQRIFSPLIAPQIPPSIKYCTLNTKHFITNIKHFVSNIKHFIPNTIYNVNFTSPHFVGDHNLSLYFPTTLSLNYQIF